MPVPILNSNQPTRAPINPRTLLPYRPMDVETYRKGQAQAQKQAIIKRGRQLGGCYISDKAENKGSVKLCDSCVTKYYGFWKQTGHRPSWNNYFTGDCDGCGQTYMLLTLFLPPDLFTKVLGGPHGRYSAPKQPLFRWPWGRGRH